MPYFSRASRLVWVLLVWMVVIAMVPRPGLAQDAPPVPAPAPSLSPTDEVAIEVESLGVGGIARLGDWAGIRVRLRDSAPTGRDVIVRLQSTDIDGDFPQQQTAVTLSPGQWRGVWLYTRLQYRDVDRTPLIVTVHEDAGVVDAGAPTELARRPGRLLGRLPVEGPVASNRLRPGTVGMMAVVGPRALGLRAYSLRTGAENHHAMGHEVTEIVDGITPADLPDRWMGLAPFDVVVWGAGEVSELQERRADAIMNWVQRGGHLVIVLPVVGQTWFSESANPLSAIMPEVVATRREGEAMAGYRPLLTNRLGGTFPARGVVHVFSPRPDATQHAAMPILSGPDGAAVVVRRLVGTGMVTLVGLDLNQTALAQFENIDADVFWHRVLGRRGNYTPSPVAAQGAPAVVQRRAEWVTDRDIGSLISITGKSAIGALVGFLVFALYWLAVGPPMYYLLKRKDMHRMAWLGFAAGTAVFTGLAWGAATLLRPARVEATHFTILDHVHGQRTQHARAWASVLIPRYGAARLSVGEPTGEAERSLSTIAAWDDPLDESGNRGAFPDVRGYPIDTLSPDAISVPVRSTVKQVLLDWAGVPSWQMPLPQAEPGSTTDPAAPPTLTLTQDWMPNTSRPLVQGWLTHNLPGPLQDGRVIVVRRQTRLTGNPSALMHAAANAYALPPSWPAGTPLDLSVYTNAQGPNALAAFVDQQLPNRLTRTLVPGQAEEGDGSSLFQRMWAMMMMHQLPPPLLQTQANLLDEGPPVALRNATHGLDLSRWLTQPCVIVVGFVGGDGSTPQASPVPLFVDGEAAPTRGLTLVRWIYPLPANPPEVGSPEEQVARPTGLPTGEEGGAPPADAPPTPPTTPGG